MRLLHHAGLPTLVNLELRGLGRPQRPQPLGMDLEIWFTTEVFPQSTTGSCAPERSLGQSLERRLALQNHGGSPPIIDESGGGIWYIRGPYQPC